MTDTTPYQPQLTQQDVEHLRLLTLFHYIVGGAIALFSCMFLIYVGIGVMMLANPQALAGPKAEVPPPAFVGWMFTAIGSLGVLGGWTLGGLTALSGRWMRAQRHFIPILVIAGIDCVFAVPFGTALGVFTFIVLLRPQVRALFEGAPAAVEAPLG